MPFKIADLEILRPRIYILGDSGSGKTYLIGLLHEMTTVYGDTNGVYLGDFDKGYPTLKDILNGHCNNMDVEIYVDSDPKNPSAWKRWSDDSERIYNNKNKEKYSFIAGDSFTTMQNALFNDIIYVMGTRIIKNRIYYRNVAMTDKADFGAFERAITNDFFPEYIKVCDMMGCIMTVHTELVQDDDNKMKVMPKVKGNALGGSTIMCYFNEAIMTKVVGTGTQAQRRVQTAKDFQVDLKSQTPGMPFDVSPEEYIFRLGVHYGYLKGEMIKKYAIDKGIDIGKLSNFKAISGVKF